jgi:capsular exopolysaccharide synthesis family protein
MLNKASWPTSRGDPSDRGTFALEPTIDFLDLFSLFRRQLALIVAALATTLFAALGYLAITPPQYTASSTVLIDTKQTPPFAPSSSSSVVLDSAYVDSQLELLKSDTLARTVAAQLGLQSDPEFVPPGHGVFQSLRRLVGLSTQSNDDLLGRAVDAFKARLTIKRIGLTYVIEAGFRSLDPEKAARISNAVVQAYITTQLDSKYQAASRAGAWLQARIGELKTKAQAAEQAAAEFKSNTATPTEATSVSEQQLAELTAKSRVALKDLESSAQLQRDLYNSMLQRSTEAIQQQLFPVTDARVISEATPPLEKSEPKSVIVIGAAAAIGMFLGLTAAFAREHLNWVFRLPAQLERDLGVFCLGLFPRLPHVGNWRRPPSESREKSKHSESGEKGRPAASNKPSPIVNEAVRRLIARDPQRYTFVIDHPFSQESEQIRFIGAEFSRVAPRSKVVGVTSALPREGKSLVAASLSQLVADAGRRTLLIDCDLRRFGLTRQLAPTATAGLGHVLAGRADFNDIVWFDPITKLDLLPAVMPSGRTAHPSGVLSSLAMQQLLESARKSYDQIILDMPPLLAFADTSAASHLIDGFIFVVELRRTRVSVAQNALTSAPLVMERLLGAVLAKGRAGSSQNGCHARGLTRISRWRAGSEAVGQ